MLDLRRNDVISAFDASCRMINRFVRDDRDGINLPRIAFKLLRWRFESHCHLMSMNDQLPNEMLIKGIKAKPIVVSSKIVEKCKLLFSVKFIFSSTYGRKSSG